MNSTGDNHQAEVVRLTQTAVEAARLGQWDVVIECYRERGVLLESAGMPVSEAKKSSRWIARSATRYRPHKLC